MYSIRAGCYQKLECVASLVSCFLTLYACSFCRWLVYFSTMRWCSQDTGWRMLGTSTWQTCEPHTLFKIYVFPNLRDVRPLTLAVHKKVFLWALSVNISSFLFKHKLQIASLPGHSKCSLQNKQYKQTEESVHALYHFPIMRPADICNILRLKKETGWTLERRVTTYLLCPQWRAWKDPPSGPIHESLWAVVEQGLPWCLLKSQKEWFWGVQACVTCLVYLFPPTVWRQDTHRISVRQWVFQMTNRLIFQSTSCSWAIPSIFS